MTKTITTIYCDVCDKQYDNRVNGYYLYLNKKLTSRERGKNFFASDDIYSDICRECSAELNETIESKILELKNRRVTNDRN